MSIDGLTLAAHWWWMIAAMILAVAEIIAPGFFLIWMAAAAMVTGMLTLVLGVPISAQLGLFAVAALTAMYGAKRWLRDNPIVSADPMLNERMARMIGQIVEVVEPIGPAGGRVRVGDGIWSAQGPALAVGEMARIVGFDGNAVIVDPA